MSLDISIKVDPGNSVAAISKVEAELAKVEGRAIAASNAASTFRRIGEHMQFMANETAKARAAVDNLAQGFKAVADHMRAESLRAVGNAFKGLADQMAREVSVLEQIRGPAREHMLNVEALEKLYKRGSITAAEYTEQLQKSGAVHGPVQKQAAEKGGFLDGLMKGGDAASELAGQLTSIAGPAALASAGIAAIGDELERWGRRTQDTRDATNTILKFHDGIESANAAMGEQRQLSEDLHVNITKTSKAYADVREATDDLGLSSKQMTDITRNLSAALIVDGGSIDGVSAIMEKLRYAQEAGVMGARELKSIWQQSPEVAEMFAKSIGKTYPELMKMAKEGKIGAAQIRTMTVGLSEGGDTMHKFGQRLRGVKEEMEATNTSVYQSMLSMQDKYVEIGETAPQIWERISAATKQNAVDFDLLAKKLQVILTLSRAQGGFATVENLIEKGTKAQGVIDGLKTPLEQYNDKLRDMGKALHQAGIYGKAFNDEINRIHPPEWVDYYKLALDEIEKPELEWAGRIKALDYWLNKGRITIEQYAAAISKLSGFEVHATPGGKLVEGKAREIVDPSAIKDIGSPGAAAEQTEAQRRNFESAMYGQTAGAQNNLVAWAQRRQMIIDGAEATKKWHDELTKTNETAALLGQTLLEGVGSFTDTLVDAANGADVSWSKTLSGIADGLEKMILKALVLEAITGSASGAAGAGIHGGFGGLLGLFGGANGFDARVPGGSGAFLPGFANGGDMLVGGSGGTDSKIAAFRVTPGETIHVRTPAQQQAMQGSAAQPVVNVHIRQDPRDLMAPVASGATDVHLNAWARRNVGLLRTILSK